MTAHALPETFDGDFAWRDLSYDVSWETGRNGIIHCRRVLNHRGDIFRAVEGLNLRDVYCESHSRSAYNLLRQGKSIRHIEVRLPKSFGPDRLYVSALPMKEGALGTFCALDPHSDEMFNSQLALLSHMSEARNREEAFRGEAEAMLQAMRILLGEDTAAGKLEALSQLLVRAIKGASHLLLQIVRDGTIRPIGSYGAPAALDQIASLIGETPVTIYEASDDAAAGLRRLLGAKSGDIALIHFRVRSDSVVLLCASRNPKGFAAVDVDVARRLALILEHAVHLKEEQDVLKHTAKLSALGQISASLAHELRQPLNTISLTAQNLELMADNGSVTEDGVRQKAERILKQVDRAAALMDRIRRFSRKSPEAFSQVNVAAMAEGLRLMLNDALLAGGADLSVEIDPELTIHTDVIQIEQLLLNLIRNAVDAISGVGAKRCTARGEVRLTARRHENGIVLRVEDNGPGFPADIEDRPLETFYTTKDAEHGTGLGLSICHMIARDHAGSLRLGNHDDGAFVELHLPERAL